MPSAVLDTNIWVSTVFKPHGSYASIIKKMKKYQLTEDVVDQAIASIRAFTTVVSRLPRLEVIKEDADDNVILACAVKAKADYLITYDPHLLRLKEYQGIKILKPKDFLTELGV